MFNSIKLEENIVDYLIFEVEKFFLKVNRIEGISKGRKRVDYTSIQISLYVRSYNKQN